MIIADNRFEFVRNEDWAAWRNCQPSGHGTGMIARRHLRRTSTKQHCGPNGQRNCPAAERGYQAQVPAKPCYSHSERYANSARAILSSHFFFFGFVFNARRLLPSGSTKTKETGFRSSCWSAPDSRYSLVPSQSKTAGPKATGRIKTDQSNTAVEVSTWAKNETIRFKGIAMSKLTMAASLPEKLRAAKEAVEICDETGCQLWHIYPTNHYYFVTPLATTAS
jgi:hypothetical protein